MGHLNTEAALAFLQKKSTTDGDSVFAHLSELIQYIGDTKPDDAVDILETSLILKNTRYIPDEGPKAPNLWKDYRDEKSVKEIFNLFAIPETRPPKNPEAEGEGEGDQEPADEEPGPEYAVDNFFADSAFFDAVGIGLGKTETYLINLTLRQLGLSRQITKARFFGKFFGVIRNYYIFEGSLSDEAAAAVPETADEEEKKLPWGRPIETIPPEEGKGPNANVYWVCTRLGGELQRLPDVTPLQIKTARAIKKFFTGNLKAEVSAYPPFPGVEENFLRAQIARISASTHIAPNGFYKLSEEDEEGGTAEENEEWENPATTELGTLEAWVHKNQYLNLQGRTSLFVPEKEEGEEEEEEDEKEEVPPSPEETEEIPPLLTPLENDAEISEGVKPWSIAFSSIISGLKHQVVCVRSLLWPGSCAVATPTGFSNIYIGWGVKHTPFVVPLPPPVLKEYEGILVESNELPPIPKPPEPEPTEGEGEEAEGREEEEEE